MGIEFKYAIQTVDPSKLNHREDSLQYLRVNMIERESFESKTIVCKMCKEIKVCGEENRQFEPIFIKEMIRVLFLGE